MVEIYFDGACEPFNPGGTASYGWIVKEKGKILAQEGGIIGSDKGMTNNVGEYTGLIKALETLQHLNIKKDKIEVFGDSDMVCNMVSKKWGWKKKKYLPHKDAPHLKVLLDKVFNLLEGYDYKIRWIPRKDNREADELSKKPLIEAGIIKPESEQQKEECPKCSGYLIERKGPFGRFFGCSKYPKCRFIKKIND